MPLPEPAPRTPAHTRRVIYQGYRRGDGLWDIEGELIDVKPSDLVMDAGEVRRAGDPVHHMHIRVTVDDHLVVRDVAVFMEAIPRDVCDQTAAPMRRMIGESMQRGWRQAIQRHLGGVQGCTHLRELLYNLGTAAFQTLGPAKSRPPGSPPLHLGKCMTWDFDGPTVERVYPMFFHWRSAEKAATQPRSDDSAT